MTATTAGVPVGAQLTIPAPANPITVDLRWTPSPNEAGTYVFTFTATDARGGSNSCSITIRVASITGALSFAHVSGPNTPEVGHTSFFDIFYDITVPAGNPFALTNITVNDFQTANVTFVSYSATQGSVAPRSPTGVIWSAGNLDPGGTASAAVRVSVTPALNLKGQKIRLATPTVIGTISGSAQQASANFSPVSVSTLVVDWTLPAFEPPTPALGTNFAVSVGQAISFDVRASDSDLADTVTLTLYKHFPPGGGVVTGAPAGATFATGNGNPVQSIFTWSPSSTQLGKWTIQFRAFDNHGVENLINILVSVDPPVFETPPTPAPDAAFDIAPGQPLIFTVRASDPEPLDKVTLGISGKPAGASYSIPVAGNPVQSTFGWTPTAAQVGTYTVTFTARDNRGPSGVGASASPRIVTIRVTQVVTNRTPVANADGPYSVPEGSSVGLNGSGTDLDGDSLTFAWDLDNNGTFETPGEDPVFSAASLNPGGRPVTIKVCDPPGACATSPSSIDVTNVGPSLAVAKSVSPASVSEGGVGNQSVTFTFTVTNTSPSTTDPVTITSLSDSELGVLAGNSTCQAGTVLAPGASCTLQVTAMVPVQNAGTTHGNTFTATGTDDEGTAASASASATVTYTNVVPQVAAAGAAIVETDVASVAVTLTDPASTDTCTLTVDWGEGAPHTEAATCNGMVTLTHQYLDDNPTGTPSDTYPISLTVTDDDGSAGQASTAVLVHNVSPVTSVTASPSTQYWGLPVSLTGSFTDVGTQDTHVATWAFGDGGGAAGLNAVHVYIDPGTYDAALTVTDDDTGVGTAAASVEISKRPTSLAYTGDMSGVFGFGPELRAQLIDTVDTVTAGIGGRPVTFIVGAVTVVGTTNVDGLAMASLPPFPPLLPGQYEIGVTFAGDSHYMASSARGTLTVLNSAGKVTAGTLTTANKGRGGLNVQSGGQAVKGELQYQNLSVNVHAHVLAALGISPDKKKAWLAGTGKNGESIVAYLEDNGEPGRNDAFTIWVDVVQYNADGVLNGGNIQIH